MKVLFIGDISGRSGRRAVQEMLPVLRKDYAPSLVIANGENAAGGLGITRDMALSLFDYGVDVITLGNHTFAKKDIGRFLDSEPRVVRPANFPQNNPGRGYGIYGDDNIAVVNLIGRVFMDPVDDPFKAVDDILEEIKDKSKIVIVDMHAETTSEKGAMGWHLDGRVSAVLGTHTHVQTSDERILPKGTGFITDAGMTGPYDSVLGLEPEVVVEKFKTMMGQRFQVALGHWMLNGVVLDIEPQTGRCLGIERIMRLEASQSGTV